MKTLRPDPADRKTRYFARALGGHYSDVRACPSPAGWQVRADGHLMGSVHLVDDRYRWRSVDGIVGDAWCLAEVVSTLIGYEVIEVGEVLQ